jgi:hypothetical protein
LQDDRLFSGSFDGSVKVWTTVRGVELKSFKAFDDSIVSCRKIPEGYFAAMANQLVYFSLDTVTLNNIFELPHFLLGSHTVEDGAYFATKNYTSLQIYYKKFEAGNQLGSMSSVEISDFCFSFYDSALGSSFIWFGLIDGSIISFSLKEAKFERKVSKFVFYLIRHLKFSRR